MKAVVATVISLALTTVVIGNAYYQKKQFYPSVVYLTNSNPSMAVSILYFHINQKYTENKLVSLDLANVKCFCALSFIIFDKLKF